MSPTLYASLLSFFGWLIRGSLMAGILVLLILTLQFLLKNKLEARWKYLLWLPVAIRLVLPWAPESSLSLYNVFSLKAVVPVHQMTQDFSEAGRAGGAAVQGEHDVQLDTGGISEIPALSHESGTVQKRGIWWNQIKQQGFIIGLMLVWLVGVLFLGAKTIYDQLRLKRVLRTSRPIETRFILALFEETKQRLGIDRNVRFVASERIPGPAVIGFRKPAIVISPSLLVTLQKEQLQYILGHEFAHIQRRDVAMNWVIHIILILHWFNPLLWVAVRKARQAQEMACDACVLDRMGPQQNKAYGQTIIHVLEYVSGNYHQPGVAGLSATHKEMKRRLIMIKQFNKKSYRLSILGMGMILALGSVTLVNPKESSAASVPAAEVVQKQKQEGKTVTLSKAETEMLQKIISQSMTKDIKLKDVGLLNSDEVSEGVTVTSVDEKYEVGFFRKGGRGVSIRSTVSLDTIQKADQDKALQKLQQLYPAKTYTFDPEVEFFQSYDDVWKQFGHASYRLKGKDFFIQLHDESVGIEKKAAAPQLKPDQYEITINANELDAQLKKKASDAVKTILNQDFHATSATLSPMGFEQTPAWTLNGDGVSLWMEASGKVKGMNLKARDQQAVKTDKEIPEQEARKVVAEAVKKLYNVDISEYTMTWDSVPFPGYRLESGGIETGKQVITVALDANKKVVAINSYSIPR
ncbi:M56 family metallopeptidase [Paenibacillus sp.]|uniref:M56 family metallopeptidase n=1 Tax=Paenibacillus sp. TaxID=58172 RepID=UPI0028301B77|nr:M56 family metallopeptidase [Paenibacillus sp.]MDR0271185.1 M56 family metallopeptidase [Paenibacillus sp.]